MTERPDPGPTLDPATSALLLVECQRGVIGDLSVLPQLARDAAPILPALGRLAAGARRAGAVVAHLVYHPVAGGRSTNRRSALMRIAGGSATWTASHPAVQVVEEIGVAPDDLVLPRHQGLSPVHRTETLAILRNLGVTDLILAGVSTNVAIPVVAVEAGDEDFRVTIPTDAVMGTPAEHHASMLAHCLGFLGRLTTVDEILAGWRR